MPCWKNVVGVTLAVGCTGSTERVEDAGAADSSSGPATGSTAATQGGASDGTSNGADAGETANEATSASNDSGPFETTNSDTTADSTTGSGTAGLQPGQVVCGDDVCDTAADFCMACDHGDHRDTHCQPRQGATLWEEFGQLFAHGCIGPGLLIECDDTSDCGAGRECVFNGGEAGIALCADAGEFFGGVACDDNPDCDPSAPTCTQIDPFGYFAPFEDVLGWMPRGCES